MKKRGLALILSALMLLSLPGCGAPPEEEAPPEDPPQTQPQAEPQPQEEPEMEGPSGVNPLTGLPMEEEEEDLRPVAVIFNNIQAAQPQLGISQADVIYEVPAEGGITRMLGVFQSLKGVETLGSIRSARPYYIELALGHEALLVHAGGSQEAYRDLSSWGVDNMDGVRGGSDAEIFWRDAERRKTKGYEHSLVTSGQKISEYVQEHFETIHGAEYTYPQTFVQDGTPAEGAAAEHFKLYYTGYKTGVFDYDPDTGKYLVSQYGEPYLDGNNGQQVSVTNVLILETSISQIPGDTEGRLRVSTTGDGKGTFFCGGKSVPILWSRTDRNHPFSYTLQDGTALSLGQGNSYVCLISPQTSRLSVEETA